MEVLARTWPWLVWVGAALIQGVALVALATRSAHGHVHPWSQDAARLAGAGRTQIWWTLTWPALRPLVVSAAYLVFMLNLADPAAPLVLGLRRTLGFQMVATALSAEPFPRLAAMALIVLAITLAGRTLVWWRGDRLVHSAIPLEYASESHAHQSPTTSWPRAAVSFLLLGCWSLLAWVPVAGLVRMGLAPAVSDSTSPPARLGVVDLLGRLTTHPAPRLLAHSLLLGLGMVAVLHLLVRRPSAGAVAGPGRSWRGAGAFLAVLVPPLVAGRLHPRDGSDRPARVAILCRQSPMAGCRPVDVTYRRGIGPHVLTRPHGIRGSLPGVPATLATHSDGAGGEQGSLWSEGRSDADRGWWPRRYRMARLAEGASGAAAQDGPLGNTGGNGHHSGPGAGSDDREPAGRSRHRDPGRPARGFSRQAAALALATIAANMLALGWASARLGRERGIEAADLA